MTIKDIIKLLPAKKEVPKPYKTHTGHISDSDMVFALGYNLYRDEAISALSKITDKESEYRVALEQIKEIAGIEEYKNCIIADLADIASKALKVTKGKI